METPMLFRVDHVLLNLVFVGSCERDSVDCNAVVLTVMSGLIDQPVTASVSISEEQFKRCLMSLTADAG